MTKIKNTAFICLYVVIGVLVVSTLIDPLAGTPGTAERFYGSIPFTLLWGVLAVLALIYIVRCKLWKMPATFLIHFAFLVILCGALTTFIWGEQGSMNLTKGISTPNYTLKDGTVKQLPFQVRLNQFEIAYYDGTHSPQDFISSFSIMEGTDSITGNVSMNNIFSYQGYRFYQAGYDPSLMASKFNISHDPYGIGITYTGYSLLLLGMLLFFFQPNSNFRKILNQKIAIMLLLLGGSLPSSAANTPKIAPKEVAQELGNLYMLHNGRVCPLQTFAQNFTTKLYGKSTYRKREAVEIFAGWVLYPDTWKKEPMIKLKGKEVKRLLDTDKTYVSLADFADSSGKYKLQHVLNEISRGNEVNGKSDITNANEKINIINSIFSGSALKIFPVKDKDGQVNWYSSVDKLPKDLSINHWTFIRKSLDLLAEKLTVHDYTEALELIHQIKAYQIKECGDALPSEKEFQAELTYNRIGSAKIWAMICVTIGLLVFFYFVYCTAKQKSPHKYLTGVLNAGLVFMIAYLGYCMYLRTIVSHHLPLSNGYETMQALAESCFLLTLYVQGKHKLAIPFGYLIGGMALLVAMMGQSNPAITNLMPVLHSPLLSIHVMVIMIAYALLAFIALNGITALFFMKSKWDMTTEVARLRRMSLLMLYPAVFLLTAGIFIGAVWANVSWGRYWGWDPKEVWALITMLIYSIPLHDQSVRFLKDDKKFHIYMALAFLSVLITYFGVNFILGGMHSYAS